MHAVIMALAVVHCGDKMDPIQGPVDTGGIGMTTYTTDIQPILSQNCIRCHSSGNSGTARNGAPSGVNFDTYALAVASSQRANVRIQAGSMPPGGGIPQSQRNLFQAWLGSGLLQ